MSINVTLELDKQGASNPILYNTQELSQLLKVSSRTIQRWKNDGTIRFAAIGSKHYFMHEDVIQMLNKHKIQSF
jgi:excisionase family DNA binding protein